MYSKARVAGHAAHPMVVVFPIALFTATVAALLAYIKTRDAFYYRAALLADVSGVATALIAMIPGLIELHALPRPSRARDLARRHAGGALLVTAVFAASAGLLYLGWTRRVMVDGRWHLDATLPLAIAVLGLVLLVGVATAGWTLVQTHHLGIKPARDYPDRPSREPELDEPRRGEPGPARAPLVTPTGLHLLGH
jgi:uncharacterized membrane protein